MRTLFVKVLLCFGLRIIMLLLVSSQALAQPVENSIDSSRKDVLVTVIDSGVSLSDEKISSVLWKNPREIPGNNIDDDNNGCIDDVSGCNMQSRDGRIEDENGSGSVISSIIASDSSHLKIVPLKVLNYKAEGEYSSATRALEYSLWLRSSTQQPVVVNVSWTFKDLTPRQTFDMFQLIQRLDQSGIVLVGAAGNDFGVHAKFPGGFANDNVVSVGALDPDGTIAPFSNSEADIGAPGVDIFVKGAFNPRGKRFGGTGVATASVTRVVAMMMYENASVAPIDLVGALFRGSDRETYLEQRIYEGRKLNGENALVAIAAR